MSPSDRPVRRYRFGVFEVDFRLGHLSKAGLRVKLAGQPLQILERLLQRPGDVVTRDELRSELWPADTFVDFEHNLNSAVKRLRAALGDSADTPRFIETLPRRGYRFLVPVESVPDSAPSAAVPETPAPSEAVLPVEAAPPPDRGLSMRRAASIAAVGASLMVLLWTIVNGWPLRGDPASDTAPSVAVLPFENLSGNEDQSYLADGTTEALIAALAQVRSIKVISRTSIMRFQGVRRPVPDIARELDVALILEGSVTRSGDRIRVTAQLIDAATDRHLWAETYTGPIGDLLSFQAQVARAVAREVHVTLSPPEEARLAQVRRVDPAVQEAFLKARYFWNQRTAKGLSQSIDYFSQAVTLDPTYAPARAGLADAYNLLPRYGTEPTRRALAQAKAHAIIALSLDPALAQAHAALPKVQHSLDWNWEGPERSFLKAIELSPGYATAHHWYSVFLLTVGRVDEGIEEARRARELDPLSPVINLHMAYSLSYADRLDDAEKSIERALELEPRYANAHYLSGWVHLRRGDAEASRAAFRTAIELTGNPREYLAGLAAAEVASGRKAEARRILAELEATRTTAEVSGQPLVWALVALGRTDDAFRILETDFENRSVCFYLFDLVNHWFLEPLRADNRLQALLDTSGCLSSTVRNALTPRSEDGIRGSKA
jgi:TolB-like protein/DNA-binding winged helix-turn-helix (wHTH) protein/Flp pilus assembly protein TadD